MDSACFKNRRYYLAGLTTSPDGVIDFGGRCKQAGSPERVAMGFGSMQWSRLPPKGRVRAAVVLRDAEIRVA